MFSLCKELHPSTIVEYAITCRFFNNLDENLVIAGDNVLKVYRLFPNLEDIKRQKLNRHELLAPPKMLLECMASYKLHGQIMSLQSVSLAGSLRDALLISFRDAKLAVLQHDADTFALKTLSLHYFEEEDIRDGWTGKHYIPDVRVDPDARCATMLVYGKKLVVLPFRKDTSFDEIEMTDVKPIKKTPMALVARTPIMASYVIALRDLDEKIDNVLDFQFLHGYFEPTLLMLFEPVRTYAGRVAVRNDTCVLVAISLNIQQRVHPIIWTVTSLPFDCLQVLPIQQPVGGCLVLATNSLIYLNQSVPPYGVSLNSTADHSTSFPLKPQPDVRITLDAARVTFIDATKLVLSLNNGDLYVLTLCIDSMRSVRSFHFNKEAGSVITSCLCLCQSEYLFLGSCLGNSVLLHIKEENHDMVITLDDATEEQEIIDLDAEEQEQQQQQHQQQQQQQQQNEQEAEPSSKLRRIEDEELEVYGSGAKTSVQLSKYSFEVCDSLFNVGNISYMCVGERAEYEADGVTMRAPCENLPELKMEIVASCGHGKNGTLNVFVNCIYPQIMSIFELPGSLDLWTVFDDPNRKTNRADQHDYLLVSQANSTMVCQTGEEINEVFNTPFITEEPTIFVGNLLQNRFTLQVTTRTLRLIQGARTVHSYEYKHPAIQASLADPFIAVLLASGEVFTYAIREVKGGAWRLGLKKHNISATPKVVAISLYKDTSGLFSLKTDDVCNLTGTSGASFFGYMKAEPHMKIEDEEDLLYGEKGSSFKMNNMAHLAKQSKAMKSDWWRRLITQTKDSFWLLAVRETGSLDIYSLPDIKLLYLINDIGNGGSVLSDAMEFVPLASHQENVKAGILQHCTPQHPNYAVPKEVRLIALGNEGNRPLLLIRTRREVLIYQVFRYAKGNLKLRFRKIEAINMFDEQQMQQELQLDDDDDDDALQHEQRYLLNSNNVSKLRYFQNVAGLKGVMICGANPTMLFLSARGELRLHKLLGNAHIRCFAAFNNVNCPAGFLYYKNTDYLQIAALPPMSYDTPWPMRSVKLRCTPQQIVYHRETRVHCLITYTEESSNKFYRFNGEDKELSEENKGERFNYPTPAKFKMVLVSPGSFDIVPDASIEFDEWEHVTAFKLVKLAYEGTRSGLKEYLCIGTNFNYSEDITSRGNLYLYDIIEVVPEPGKPLTRFKLKQILKKEQKGPVSAICDVLGLLVTALGQKIYLWQLADDDLAGVAFIDTNLYVHHIISMKSHILVADIEKSISLLYFQEAYRTLSLASRDYQPLEIFSTEFMVDNSNLGFLVSDVHQNFIVYMYQPESRESQGGQKLLRKADYHLGKNTNTMFRVACHQRGINQRQPFLYENKHMVFFGTLSGSIGHIVPLPERVYRRLLMLQNILTTYCQHLAGLNPKAYRTVKNDKKLSLNPCRGIVDGDLLCQFGMLSMAEKNEVAKKIGTRTDELQSDLLELERLAAIF